MLLLRVGVAVRLSGGSAVAPHAAWACGQGTRRTPRLRPVGGRPDAADGVQELPAPACSSSVESVAQRQPHRAWLALVEVDVGHRRGFGAQLRLAYLAYPAVALGGGASVAKIEFARRRQQVPLDLVSALLLACTLASFAGLLWVTLYWRGEAALSATAGVALLLAAAVLRLTLARRAPCRARATTRPATTAFWATPRAGACC
jgi:hypothetical protein